jgi:hypothetical protein
MKSIRQVHVKEEKKKSIVCDTWNEWACNRNCTAVVLLHHQYKEDRNNLHHPSCLNRPYLLCYHHRLSSLLSNPLPTLGMIGNPIVVSDDKDDIKSSLSRPSYHKAQLTFTTPSLQLLHCQDCTDQHHYYFDCHQYICDHCLMNTPHHQVSDVTNNTILLLFFDMLLPYAFHFTYLNTSLPAGVHESPNICLTCVCLMVNTPLPLIYHMFNMLFMHVHVIFCYYLNW